MIVFIEKYVYDLKCICRYVKNNLLITSFELENVFLLWDRLICLKICVWKANHQKFYKNEGSGMAGLRDNTQYCFVTEMRTIIPELQVSPCEDVECQCGTISTSCEDLTSCRRHIPTCWRIFENQLVDRYVWKQQKTSNHNIDSNVWVTDVVMVHLLNNVQ